jgi:hypothetical protein
MLPIRGEVIVIENDPTLQPLIARGECALVIADHDVP